MPTLFNQTKHPLSWDMGGRAYSCAPWGPVELAESLVTIAKGYGLPLGPVPIAPEIRAQRIVEDEKKAAEDEALQAMRKELAESKAETANAVAENEKLQLQLQRSNSKARELADQVVKLERERDQALEAKAAAEAILADTVRQATESEERAIRADALKQQAKKPKPSAPQPK